MRRLTLFIYSALVMLVGASVLGTTLSVAQVSVELSDVTGRVGTSGTIPIIVGDLTGEDVISYEFTVSYDESIVELTGVTVDGTLSDGTTPTVNTATPGELRVSFAQASALTGSGTLIHLNASFESEGTSALTFDNFLFNEGDPAVELSNGSVLVAERAISAADGFTAFVGQEDVLIPITVDALSGADDVISFEFNVSYDPTVLDITGGSTTGTLSEGFSVESFDVSAGEIRIVAAGTEAIEGEGTLINLVADPINPGTSDLTLSNVVFNEGTPVLASIDGDITVTSGEPFQANLAGYNEVDPVESDGTGSVSATLIGDELVLSGSFSDLTSAYSASHIHLAPAGENGGVEIPLSPTVDADDLGGSFETANNTFTLDDEQIAALRAGDLYVNVHTANNPGGELRGQLLDAPNSAPSAVSLTSPADGANIVIEGDPTETVSFEWTISTDPDGDDVYYVLQTAVSPDFTDSDPGEIVFATSETLSYADLGAFLADAGVDVGESLTVYVRANAHDGSLRSVGDAISVTLTRGILSAFQANLAGVNEVPPVGSVGSGTVVISLNDHELTVTGSFENLVSNFTASHIHLAPVGENGPVVVPLEVETSDDMRSGVYTAADNTFDLDTMEGVDADAVVAAIEGGTAYVNVHSTAYPGGELRGQILALGNSAPEESAITTPAVGSEVMITGNPDELGMTVGFESADDPDGDRVAYVYQLAADANFENVVEMELRGDAAGIEFSVDDLADIFDEIAEVIAIGERLRVYHRVVTTDGGLWTAGPSSALVLERGAVTGVGDDETLPQDFALHGNYPNPFNPSTTVTFDLPQSADVTINVVDALGREVLSVPVQSVQAGASRVLEIDASSLASGTYVYRVIAKGATSTMVGSGTMTLVK